MSQFLSVGDDAADAKELHEALPRPSGTVVSLSLSKTKEQLMNYALAGYHYCVDQVYRGINKTLWIAASRAYFNAQKVISQGNLGLTATGMLSVADGLASAARVATKAVATVAPSMAQPSPTTDLPMAAEMLTPPPPGASNPPYMAIGAGVFLFFLLRKKK